METGEGRTTPEATLTGAIGGMKICRCQIKYWLLQGVIVRIWSDILGKSVYVDVRI